MRKKLIVCLMYAASCVFMGTATHAQNKPQLPGNYPMKPVRILVGFTPGGSNDLAARILANGLTERWGTNWIVENRPGGSGVNALQTVAHAAPDGYTLYVGGNQIATAMMKQQAIGEITVDVRKAFSPVVEVMMQPYVIAVASSLPVKSVKELIAYAKSKPGQLNYSSTGIGAASHLNSELFCQMAGVKMVNVPYKGASLIALDLGAGRIQMSINNVVSVMPNIRSGKIRALAITSLKRARIMPELPTADESGLPGFEVISWLGVFAPLKIPQPLVLALNKEATRIFNDPDTVEKIATDGSEPVAANTPGDFKTFFIKEVDKWENLVKTAGIKLE